MHTIKLIPINKEVMLPHGSSLTELEFECFDMSGITFGCRAGVCGACVIQVMQGIEYLGDKRQEERGFLARLGFPDDDFRLACQCTLNGAVTIRIV